MSAPTVITPHAISARSDQNTLDSGEADTKVSFYIMKNFRVEGDWTLLQLERETLRL